MKILIGLIAAFVILVSPALAALGVGVGTGKIYVEEKLKPGVIYNLPELTVLNTGDIASSYELSVEFHENQTQMRPERSWFAFSPDKFYLEPGSTQVVKIRINLPLKVQPGDYFAFLSAHPTINSKSGDTIIGVAAASKLYFTIEPASVLHGLYYRALTYWQNNEQVLKYLFGVMGIIVVVAVVRKNFNIEIKAKTKKTKLNKESEKDE